MNAVLTFIASTCLKLQQKKLTLHLHKGIFRICTNMDTLKATTTTTLSTLRTCQTYYYAPQYVSTNRYDNLLCRGILHTQKIHTQW